MCTVDIDFIFQPLPYFSELSFKSGNFTVVENEGSVEVCVILTKPVDTVVDTIVRSSAGSATSGIVVEKVQNVVHLQALEAVSVCFSKCTITLSLLKALTGFMQRPVLSKEARDA